MSHRVANDMRTTRRAGVGVVGAVRHALTVWFALLGLVVQLSAAGACTAGASMPVGAQGPFPICHAYSTAGDQGRTGGGHPTPGQHDDCPCCSIHCHAAIALPPSVGVPVPVSVATTDTQLVVRFVEPAPRCHAGASPRGPPTHV